jgi:hypothetical protein
MLATIETADVHQHYRQHGSHKGALTQPAVANHASVAKTNRFFARLTIAMIVLTNIMFVAVCVYSISI